mmetsp:Transcript_26879/g.77435  ORF Transcript_26879/g.77435 Transcript_26879/m.77435 type:complete len:207 (-) Transcript_26879:1066-1686(-)
MSSRFRKKLLSSRSPGESVSAPSRSPARSMARKPATSRAISLALRPNRCARSTSWLGVPLLRKPSLAGSSTWKDSTSVCFCVASPRPVATATFRAFAPPRRAASSTAAEPASTMKSAMLTPPSLLRTSSYLASTLLSSAGLLIAQSFWGDRHSRAPLAPPRKSVCRNVHADAHAVRIRSVSDSVPSSLSSAAAFSASTLDASSSLP